MYEHFFEINDNFRIYADEIGAFNVFTLEDHGVYILEIIRRHSDVVVMIQLNSEDEFDYIFEVFKGEFLDGNQTIKVRVENVNIDILANPPALG